MRRVIVDYKKLNNDILDLLVEKFPDGYSDNDIIAFKNQHNEAIEAVEVRTEDTIYLVKISQRLVDTMEKYDDDDDTTSTLASDETELEGIDDDS
ncbi:hypothetical protein GCM10022393_30670 [Aquimarina addita]|uniref:DNA primase n=1 Tax=Aquimarina addita TaxID=870485 RepID=A0ABP6UNY3_9FLAO